MFWLGPLARSLELELEGSWSWRDSGCFGQGRSLARALELGRAGGGRGVLATTARSLARAGAGGARSVLARAARSLALELEGLGVFWLGPLARSLARAAIFSTQGSQPNYYNAQLTKAWGKTDEGVGYAVKKGCVFSTN